jgi:hypothetical protein
LPVHEQGQVAELAADRLPVGQLAQAAQVVPAEPGQVADLVGVAGARAEPERQVPAQVGTDGGHGEPGGGQQAAASRPPAGPGRQRADEQGGRAGLAYGVRKADPLLIGVQGRPVSQPGGRGRRAARDPGGDEHLGRAAGATEQVKYHRRRPAAERQPDQRGVRGLAERNAVQRIGARPRGKRSHHGV